MNRRHQKNLARTIPATLLSVAFALVSGPAIAAPTSPAIPSVGWAAASTAPSALGDGTDEPSVSLDVDTESTALDDDDPLRLTVTVDNTTLVDLPAGRVVLTAGTSTIGSRATLHAHLDGTDPLPTDRELVEITVPSVVAGSSFTSDVVDVPNDRLDMPEDYGAVPLTGSFSAGETRVDAHGTYVAAAASPSNSIGVSIVMPITAPTGQRALIDAESLATYTAPGGVLSRQLDGAAGQNVALAVDPLIVASIRALGATAPASSRAWLERLDTLPNETFPLQFADADGSVQAAAGLDALLAPTSLEFGVPVDFTAVEPTETPTPTGTPQGDPEEQVEAPEGEQEPARPALEDLLAFDWTADDVLWPAEGTVTTDGLEVFAASGVVDTIVSSANLAGDDIHPAASGAGEHGLLVSDAAISATLRDAATAVTASAFADAVSTLSAELAVAARESGATGRTILATLDRGWPPTAVRLGDALDEALSLPTVDAVALDEVRAEERTEVALGAVDADASRINAVSVLMDREAQVDRFSSVLTTPELLTGRERAEILGLLAVDWIDIPEEWSDALSAHSEQTARLLESVSILNPSDVLLVGNESAIPFGVRNDSPYDVTVAVEATPSNVRLDVGEPQTIEVSAGSRQTVRVPVKAQLGNGDVSLTVTLSSLTGERIGPPVTATVAVRADWEGIGAVIFVGLIVAMLVAGIVRTILRRRNRAGPATTDSSANADPSANAGSSVGAAPSTGPDKPSGTDAPTTEDRS